MFSSDQYQLIDFGDGRRLERFGRLLLDRPCPAAEGFQRADPQAWSAADARFDRTAAEQGRWTSRGTLPQQWTIAHGRLRLGLKRSGFGHLGVFPEQAANWDWIAEVLRPIAPPGKTPARAEGGQSSQCKVLNLFAYTGGSTLAAAAAGAEVTHVDAARNTIARARRNAELSGMSAAPIRWIAEDAGKFVRRELRRGNRYEVVILDPPSYGHGPRGEVWRLSKHLPRLLADCGELTAGRCRFMILTCHTPGFDPQRLKEMIVQAKQGTDTTRAEPPSGRSDGSYLPPFSGGVLEAEQLTIRSAADRDLPSGVVVRWRQAAEK